MGGVDEGDRGGFTKGRGSFKPRIQNVRHSPPPGPPPGVDVIDVDAISDGEDLPYPAHEPPESLSLRSQSTSSQIYWDGTLDLTMVFDSLPEPTQRAPENPPPAEGSAESLSTLKSFQSGVSTSSTVVSRNASTSSGSLTPLSVVRKRPASAAFSPFEELEQTNGIAARNVRLRFDPENPFDDTAKKSSTETTDDLNKPVFIAHSCSLVKLFDHRCLSTGVRWELARLLTTKGCLDSYDELDISLLNDLKGSNAEAAPKVFPLVHPTLFLDDDSPFLKALARESAHKSPWRELDEEEYWLKVNRYGGLGCDSSVLVGEKEYYGGKVHFIARLRDDKGTYSLGLEQAELGPSSRFSRRFGSAAFIKVAIPKKIMNKKDNKLMEFMTRPFVLNGRVFRAFYSKENNVHLKKTNERVVEGVIKPPKNESDLVDGQGSLIDFLNWHNPPSKNLDKTMVKYTARMALGLSNSVPAVRVAVENIHSLRDMTSELYDGKGKLHSEMDMSDGCGLINAAALRKIQEKLDLDSFPTAVQVRFRGAKGLLCLDEDGKYKDATQDPSVGLRPSQDKINHFPESVEEDPTFRTIEVLRTSRMTSPARLSAEIIVNLSENGVDDKVFKDLMCYGLDEITADLTCWDSNSRIAMANLWINVAKSGGVINARLARIAAGESRARGFGDRDDDDSDDEDDEDVVPPSIQKSTAWWADPVSGCPSSLEETVLVLIDSGFTPQSCPILAEKLKYVLKTSLEKYVLRYKMVVPMSCEALVIPDPIGVLEPGEIHIKRSRPMLGPNGFESDIVMGDVLVTRHPCKVPSDVQKVKAVQHNALSQYVDVIIFPVKGKRSLASMLGGGDYDGDRVYAIWQPEIVSKFKNADDKYASAPPEVLDAFERNSESVEAFLKRSPPEDPAKHLLERQKYLLAGLFGQSLVGAYSMLHDKAVYALGYNHPKTIYTAYMFCNVLDGSKTGLKVKRGAFRSDMQHPSLMGGLPLWRDSASTKDQEYLVSEDNLQPVRRAKDHKKFIMDTIREEGRRQMAKHMKSYNDKVEGCDLKEDEALSRPWKEAVHWAEETMGKLGEHVKNAILQDLGKVKEHVHMIRQKHRSKVAINSPRKSSTNSPRKKSSDSGGSFSEMKIEDRQDILRALSREFADGPLGLQILTEEVNGLSKIKASYAYIHDREASAKTKKWTRFPFDVAMATLGEIKAKENGLGLAKTCTTEMYENKTTNSLIRPSKLHKST